MVVIDLHNLYDNNIKILYRRMTGIIRQHIGIGENNEKSTETTSRRAA